jgi:acetyl-CoA C-acetyltransferase
MSQKTCDRLPILVGCGDVMDTTTAVELVAPPSNSAGTSELGDAIDTLVMLRLLSDTSPRLRSKLGASGNPPRSISRRLGINPARHIYTSGGGKARKHFLT